jgi:hypothetical protein
MDLSLTRRRSSSMRLSKSKSCGHNLSNGEDLSEDESEVIVKSQRKGQSSRSTFSQFRNSLMRGLKLTSSTNSESEGQGQENEVGAVVPYQKDEVARRQGIYYDDGWFSTVVWIEC